MLANQKLVSEINAALVQVSFSASGNVLVRKSFDLKYEISVSRGNLEIKILSVVPIGFEYVKVIVRDDEGDLYRIETLGLSPTRKYEYFLKVPLSGFEYYTVELSA